jgi:hypothetical protein
VLIANAGPFGTKTWLHMMSIAPKAQTVKFPLVVMAALGENGLRDALRAAVVVRAHDRCTSTAWGFQYRRMRRRAASTSMSALLSKECLLRLAHRHDAPPPRAAENMASAPAVRPFPDYLGPRRCWESFNWTLAGRCRRSDELAPMLRRWWRASPGL